MIKRLLIIKIPKVTAVAVNAAKMTVAQMIKMLVVKMVNVVGIIVVMSNLFYQSCKLLKTKKYNDIFHWYDF
ncbi:MAG: hypothetical protein WCJ19_02235 [bacterium]